MSCSDKTRIIRAIGAMLGLGPISYLSKTIGKERLEAMLKHFPFAQEKIIQAVLRFMPLVIAVQGNQIPLHGSGTLDEGLDAFPNMVDHASRFDDEFPFQETLDVVAGEDFESFSRTAFKLNEHDRLTAIQLLAACAVAVRQKPEVLEKGVRALKMWLADPDPFNRQRALMGLARVAVESPEAADAVVAGLKENATLYTLMRMEREIEAYARTPRMRRQLLSSLKALTLDDKYSETVPYAYDAMLKLLDVEGGNPSDTEAFVREVFLPTRRLALYNSILSTYHTVFDSATMRKDLCARFASLDEDDQDDVVNGLKGWMETAEWGDDLERKITPAELKSLGKEIGKWPTPALERLVEYTVAAERDGEKRAVAANWGRLLKAAAENDHEGGRIPSLLQARRQDDGRGPWRRPSDALWASA